jgi:hypothetical protein
MAGTIKTDVIQSELTTPTVFRNTSGTEIGRLVRAFCNYNSSASTVTGSFNTSSITKNATGDVTVNYTSAMSDATYTVSSSFTRDNTNNYNYGHTYAPGLGTFYVTGSIRMYGSYYSASTLYDFVNNHVAVFR